MKVVTFWRGLVCRLLFNCWALYKKTSFVSDWPLPRTPLLLIPHVFQIDLCPELHRFWYLMCFRLTSAQNSTASDTSCVSEWPLPRTPLLLIPHCYPKAKVQRTHYRNRGFTNRHFYILKSKKSLTWPYCTLVYGSNNGALFYIGKTPPAKEGTPKANDEAPKIASNITEGQGKGTKGGLIFE